MAAPSQGQFGAASTVNSGLERLLIQARACNGPAAARVIVQQALSTPDVHVFSELLETQHIANLAADAESKPLHDLLSIFAYGTYPDYKASRSNLPELEPPQLEKLKLLTISQLAFAKKTLSYQDLRELLDLDTTRELEDLIITGIYRGLFGGTLDQKQQQFRVTFASSRDVNQSHIDKMIDTLHTWCVRCENMTAVLRKEMARADQSKTAAADKQAAVQQEVTEKQEALKAAGKSAGARGSSTVESQDLVASRRTARHARMKNTSRT